MAQPRFGSDVTFGRMTSELLKIFGDRAVPLKQHAGMFLGALALPKTDSVAHDDMFDYRLKLLAYDQDRSERLVRVFSRAEHPGYFMTDSKIEYLDHNGAIRATIPLGTSVVADEVCIPELREYAKDALHFEEELRLEKLITATFQPVSL